MADEIIARIPPLPQLSEKAPSVPGETSWSTRADAMVRQCENQTYSEPWERFIERFECYWRRGCSMRTVQARHLGKAEERELIRACWLKLTLPSQLPGFPAFWY